MKNIKLLALLLTSLHITPMHKDQYAYRQELNDIVIQNPELDRIFTSMQACDSAQGSFRQFIENTLTSGHYDQQKASPRVIISQAEELISEKLKSNEAFSKKMKYQFIDAVNSVIAKDRVKKAQIKAKTKQNYITSVREQDKSRRGIRQVDVQEQMDIITAQAEAMADKVQDPMFLYFTQNKNKSIQNIVRQWLLQEWELEWSRTDTLRQNHCNNTSTPLYTAISNTNTEIASMLVNAQVNFNIKDRHGNSPLHVATINIDCHDPEVTSMLINAGANIDMQNNNGETPLHILASQSFLAVNKSLSIARLFINAHADVNIQNNNGDTPLHIAAKNNFHVAQLLINIGADIDMQNKNDETPLHIAAKNNFHVAQLLINIGAHLNIKNNNGDTPLHILASQSSHTPQINSALMELLIRAGADINFQNNKGETPLDMATQKNPLVATILKNAGARYYNDKTSYNNISTLHAPCTELIQTQRPEPAPTVIEQVIPETPSCCNIS